MPAEGKKVIATRIEARLGYVNQLLGKQNFMAGKSFTAADAYAFTVINWCNMVGIDLSKWPNVAAFMGRVASRPAVQAALKAEGLIK
jgi:glutathione S-transferase